jgi:hypothetical protein
VSLSLSYLQAEFRIGFKYSDQLVSKECATSGKCEFHGKARLNSVKSIQTTDKKQLNLLANAAIQASEAALCMFFMHDHTLCSGAQNKGCDIQQENQVKSISHPS